MEMRIFCALPSFQLLFHYTIPFKECFIPAQLNSFFAIHQAHFSCLKDFAQAIIFTYNECRSLSYPFINSLPII